MYIRGTPPANVSIEAVLSWLLLELAALEQELNQVNEELAALKEAQNAV